jgi:tRNA pseudouridine32 synthase/23S rRNA pseudouridine746 synthase
MNGQMLPILYQDRAIAVIDKPGGLLAVPGRGPDKQDSAVSRLRRLAPWCIEQPAVHRLDMDTAGLMVLGLTREAHRRLSIQFAERRVGKRYLALVEGVVAGEAGEIRLAFRLDPDNRPHQVYDPEQGKVGVSQWRAIAVSGGRTLVEFTPLTGRTHQLRLHASHGLGLGCPIVGDRLYGAGQPGEPLRLHATWLQFFHPETEQLMEFFSPAPFAPV